MLNKIKVRDLKLGDRYTAHIFFDDGHNMLVLKGSSITETELEILKRWKMQYVLTAGHLMTEGESIDDLELEEIDEVEEIEEICEVEEDIPANTYPISGTKIAGEDITAIPSNFITKITKDPASHELYSEYLSIIGSIDKIFECIKKRQSVENMGVSQYAIKLQELIKKNPPLCVGFILGTELECDNLARSSVNATILAIILSEALELSNDKINEVAIASLLHDVGMTKIPSEILKKSEALTDIEKQAIAAHTAYGFKIAMSEFLYPKEIAVTIMQHHERWDGKGHPNGIMGKNIDIGARIISVADAFVAMITPKPYRPLMLGYQAMKNILADNGRIFDPEIIRAMIRSIGIYPIGSIVLMNDASLARVVKSSPEAPMRPFIKILIDKTGIPVENHSTILDLKENKNIFIVRAVDPRAYKR